ncbi:MAG: hypothetical protein IKD54_03770 [Clostridia bacterium]|nr:hypothetical protein [Clostridia bacterium]MBR3129584.1 hypothetical protein [Clostridia bacterium]
MRAFLINICPTAIWCIVACEALIAVLLFAHAARKKSKVAFWSGVLTLGLILDAAIIGLGSVLPQSTLSEISPIRFIAHGLLIPLLFPICAYALNFRKLPMVLVWMFTVLVMAFGVAQALVTVLEPKELAGVVRYAAGEGTPRWAEAISRVLSFGTVIPMMIVGVIVWIKEKTPHLFLSGLLMFVFSALGPATGNADLIFFISMFGELLMVLFLYLYARAKTRRRNG